MEDNDKNVIDLYNQSLSHNEIAAKFGVSRGAISGRIKRIKARDPSLLLERRKNVHPLGKRSEKIEVKKKPNRYTFRTRPFGYIEPTKNEMRMMLREAVVNTK